MGEALLTKGSAGSSGGGSSVLDGATLLCSSGSIDLINNKVVEIIIPCSLSHSDLGLISEIILEVEVTSFSYSYSYASLESYDSSYGLAKVMNGCTSYLRFFPGKRDLYNLTYSNFVSSSNLYFSDAFKLKAYTNGGDGGKISLNIYSR